MADADDLDDFFAKKDKSKKKSKSKIKPDDILAQQDADKPKKKKKSKAPAASEKTPEEEKKAKEDEEWAEVVEEETDYSGLRIATLQVSNKEEEENETEEGAEDGEGGEGGDKKEEPSGPWAKLQTDDRVAAPPPQPEQAPEPKPDPLAGKVQGGKYIPPARRGLGGTADSPAVIVTSSHSSRRKPKVAPNLQSESDFPTLGGAADHGGPAMHFEEVRSGGKQMEDPSKKKLNLQLDNKFDALQAD